MPVDRPGGRCRCGALERLERGRYILVATPETGPPEPEQPWVISRQQHLTRVEAAIFDRSEVVLAGASAAAAWDLPCPDPWGDWSRLPVTLASDRPVRYRPGVRRIALRGRAVTRAEGLPVTSLLDTATDIALHLPLPEALIVIDAVARRLAGDRAKSDLGHEALRRCIRDRLLATLARRGRSPNVARARAALAAADPAADSPPESFARGHVLLAGLPVPEVNPRIMGASGRGYFPDLLFREQRLVVEIDGRMKYADDLAVVYREKVREDDLRAAGWDTVRWPAVDVLGHPASLVADLRVRIELRSPAIAGPARG